MTTSRRARLTEWLRSAGLEFEEVRSGSDSHSLCNVSHRNGSFPVFVRSEAEWIRVSAPVVQLAISSNPGLRYLRLESAQLRVPVAGFTITFDDGTVFLARDELWRDTRTALALADRLQLFARVHEYLTMRLVGDVDGGGFEASSELADLIEQTEAPTWNAVDRVSINKQWPLADRSQSVSRSPIVVPELFEEDSKRALLPIEVHNLMLVASYPRGLAKTISEQLSSLEKVAVDSASNPGDYSSRIAEALSSEIKLGLLRSSEDIRKELRSLLVPFLDCREDAHPDLQRRFAEDQTMNGLALIATFAFFSGSPKTEFDRVYELLVGLLVSGAQEVEPSRRDSLPLVPVNVPQRPAQAGQVVAGPFEFVDGRRDALHSGGPTADDFLLDFWGAASFRLRQIIIDWLTDAVHEVDGDGAARLSQRLATFTRIDRSVGIALLETWASSGQRTANALAALTVDAMAADESTRSFALAIAKDWAKATEIAPKQYSALDVYTGTAGVLNIRQAIRVYRYQWTARPFAAAAAWSEFTLSCAKSHDAGLELADAMSQLGVVRSGKIDDPAFLMIDRWFADGLNTTPLALRLILADPEASCRIASVIACSLQRSYRHEDWLFRTISWTDTNDDAIAAVAIRLLYDAFIALGVPQQTPPLRDPSELPDRAWMVRSNIQKYMTLTHRRLDGPSMLAVERSLATIDEALKCLAGKADSHG